MKILHLPVNVASIPSHTVRGLREKGIDAYGLVFGSKFCSSEGLMVIKSFSKKENIFLWGLQKIIFSGNFLKMLKNVDLIHWYCGSPVLPFSLDLKYIKFLKKPVVVEWLGSEIRIPEIEFADNPYYREVFFKGYEYSYEEKNKSYLLQEKFAKYGFSCIVSMENFQYIRKDIWKNIYILPAQRIVLSDYQPVYPDPENSKLLIVHSPTAFVAKGTPAVLKAVEKLKSEYEFEFQLLYNLPHQEVLRVVKSSDIFLDQFVIGSYGMAAVEAMAFGKPVVCYIKDSLIKNYPPDFPVINANQENLVEVLRNFLKDGNLRKEIGKKSREYVEKYHSMEILGNKLLEIYKEILK